MTRSDSTELQVPGTETETLATITNYLKSDEIQEELRAAIPQRMRTDLNAERATRSAIMEISNNRKEMERCTPRSIGKAVIEAAQSGLVVNGMLALAYIVRYGNEAKFQVGYRGKIALMTRHSRATNVNANVVHEHDRFELDMANNVISHTPWDVVGAEEKGRVLGYYAIAHFDFGGKQVEWIRLEEVSKIRANAKKQNKGKESPAWREWPDEMGKKCAVHRLGKKIDMDPAALAVFFRDSELGFPVAPGEEPVKAKTTPAGQGKDPNDISDIAANPELGNAASKLADRNRGEAESQAQQRCTELFLKLANVTKDAYAPYAQNRLNESLAGYNVDNVNKLSVDQATNVATRFEGLLKYVDDMIGRANKKGNLSKRIITEVHTRMAWWTRRLAEDKSIELLPQYMPSVNPAEVFQWKNAVEIAEIESVLADIGNQHPDLKKRLEEERAKAKEKESKKGD